MIAYLILLGLFIYLVWRALRPNPRKDALAQLQRDHQGLERRVNQLEQDVALLNLRVMRSAGQAMGEVERATTAAIHPTEPPLLSVEPSDLPWDGVRGVGAEGEALPTQVGGIALETGESERIPAAETPRDLIPSGLPSIRKPVVNWEQFVGVKLFAWLGGLALFFAAVLGLKYSFEHDLVPPTVRAACGFLLGAGLLVAGARLKLKQYTVASQTLCATGVVILYAVTFACRAFYHFEFFGPVPTFLLMTLITATAFLLAVRLDAQVVAVLGMLGGFLTPVMLSTGEDNPLGLFGYVALLDLGLLAVTRRKRWDYLALLAAAGTVLMQIGWFMKFFAVEKIFVAQGVFLGFPLLFLGGFVWANKRDWMNEFVAAAAAAPALVALALSFDIALGGELGQLPGRTFTIAFGADLALLAIVALRPRLRVLESIGGAALFLLLSLWTLGPLNAGTMYWGLGLYLAFAVLHTVFPIALKKLRPETPPAGLWSQFIPAAVLLLAMLPIVRELTVPWLFWAVVLAVDVLAVLMALAVGALLGLVAVLVFTVAATAVWLAHSTAQAVDLSESVVVIGGFALFFFGASAFVWRRLLSAPVNGGPALSIPGVTRIPGLPLDVSPLIPALSAVLPFLLLIMVTAQFKPANPSPVFGLAAMLVTLILGLAKVTRLDALLAVALGSVGMLELAWIQTSLDPEHALIPLLWFLGFYTVLTAFPFVFQREYQSRHLPWAVAALAGPVQFGFVYWLVRTAYPNPVMGLLPAAFAVPALMGLFRLLKTLAPDAPQRLALLAWFGGVVLFFVTLIFPIQFDKQWITVAWALEGAAVCWLFHRVPHPGLRGVGLGLLLTAFLRLTLNPAVFSYHERSATPILNWFLYTYATVIACHFVAARLLAPPRDVVRGVKVPPILQGLGTFLAFLLLNIEIADFYSTGSSLTFEFSGSLSRDMTYTIAWALFALGLMVVGIRRRQSLVRYAGVGLLCVALLKLFIFDLANLSQLYRVGTFAAVAVIAFAASFLYQRFLATENRPTKPVPSDET